MEQAKFLKNLLEALLFSSPRPLTAEEMAKSIEASVEDILPQLEALQKEYEEREGGLAIRFRRNKWQMVVKPEYGAVIRERSKGASSKTISRAALETLAIISLYQPLTKTDVDLRRGVDSSQAIRTLLEYGLVTICGKSEAPGKPFLYRVTEKFFETFGIEGEDELQRILRMLKENGETQ
ncbi:MAG: SMC-Scp complex subunit ScpB [Candidatus Atribacteria bacterium]|nr:SMC-Scp complex subunit ScpB [Candidatus Atribacteria bacterium]